MNKSGMNLDAPGVQCESSLHHHRSQQTEKGRFRPDCKMVVSTLAAKETPGSVQAGNAGGKVVVGSHDGSILAIVGPVQGKIRTEPFEHSITSARSISYRSSIFIHVTSSRCGLVSCIYEVLPSLAIVCRWLCGQCFTIAGWHKPIIILDAAQPFRSRSPGFLFLVAKLAATLGDRLLPRTVRAHRSLKGRKR